MCEKCWDHPENRNTRYCDDWWRKTWHGGYARDKEEREELARKSENERMSVWSMDDAVIDEDW